MHKILQYLEDAKTAEILLTNGQWVYKQKDDRLQYFDEFYVELIDKKSRALIAITDISVVRRNV